MRRRGGRQRQHGARTAAQQALRPVVRVRQIVVLELTELMVDAPVALQVLQALELQVRVARNRRLCKTNRKT